VPGDNGPPPECAANKSENEARERDDSPRVDPVPARAGGDAVARIAGRAVKFEATPVGVVESSRSVAEDDYWGGEQSCIVLSEAFDEEALLGLESFSHVEIVFFFHEADPAKIVSGARHPRNNPDWPKVGIFAQRAKNRPNRIGTTICRLLRRQGRRLFVAELDAISGSPVLDIKPVMREFLPRSEVRQPKWVGELMRNYWSTGMEDETS
jgi:tRNA-Thr(GGU) m(6)t(6)A37 methyltransferase TsaA